jgi:HPt (histidine-containing phosphotransfer) domain-containing protein
MMDASPIDLTAGIAACAGSRDLHQQVASLLAGDIDARVAAVATALASGDLEAVARLAHKHKGACLAVGAVALAETFAAIDRAARAADVTTAARRATVLRPEAEAFKAAVAVLA